MTRTIVLGASPKSYRYSHKATIKLKANGHEVVPIGLHSGTIDGIEILDLKSRPHVPDIHTITIYLATQNQDEWINYMLSLKPQRIIFNPGTENEIFAHKARSQSIETIEACTLVMLTIGNY